jgi:hypothetical protein
MEFLRNRKAVHTHGSLEGKSKATNNIFALPFLDIFALPSLGRLGSASKILGER